MKNTTQASSSIGFAGLLTIVLITLKLTGHIDWSWIWVLSPLWLGAAIGLVIGAALFLLVIVMSVYEVFQKNRKIKRL
jgi:hypothetical protein